MNKTAKCSTADRQDIQGSQGALTVALIMEKIKHYT